MIQPAFLGFVLLFFTATLSTPLNAQEDSPPVKALMELCDQRKDVAANLQAMLANVQPLADGTENPWKGKKVEDLYSFLNEWYFFLPDTHNGLDRIIEFSLLWYKNPAGEQFILTEPGLSWSLSFIEERGKYMDSPASTKNIAEWLADTTLGNEDFEEPEEGFKSFNEFFTRDLKPGVRPVADPEDDAIVVSPADGVINMINNQLLLETEIPTKAGMCLSLNKLLDHSQFAEKFEGGTALAVFLLPTNYHHYHAPVSGKLVESKETVGDRLFGMPDIPDMVNKGNPGYNKDLSVFHDFKHGYFIFKTEVFGYVAMVPIGLQTVGSVVFEEPYREIRSDAPVDVQKGEKLGHFAYGGSTVLLFFEKGRLSSLTVQQGQRIGKLSN